MGGGTPRRVHSRPNAAMAFGWAEKNDGLLPHGGEQLVEVVGGRALAGLDAHVGVGAVEQPVRAVVQDLVLLLLLELLDGERELLFHLIHRAAEQVRHAGVHGHGGGDRGEHVLARLRVIVAERDGQRLARRGAALDRELVVEGLVDPVDTCFDGVPGSICTSHRGVAPRHCGGVLVVFESCRAARSPSVRGLSAIVNYSGRVDLLGRRGSAPEASGRGAPRPRGC